MAGTQGGVGVRGECQSGQMRCVKGALALAYGGSNPPSLIVGKCLRYSQFAPHKQNHNNGLFGANYSVKRDTLRSYWFMPTGVRYPTRYKVKNRRGKLTLLPHKGEQENGNNNKQNENRETDETEDGYFLG